MDAISRTFPVMGSTAALTVVGGDDTLMRIAAARLRDLERRWSRFRPDSEISVYNRSDGSPVPVSPETCLLVERAEAGRTATGGRFDPTCLDAVVALGYDRSFVEIDRPVRGPRVAVDGRLPVLDRDARTIARPANSTFDPGGIGKGLAADIVVSELRDLGARGVALAVGGDVRVSGVSPSGDAWRVAVRTDPSGPVRDEIQLGDGAVATSTRRRRRWVTAEGTERHHIVDPSTGDNPVADIVAATVVAAEGWQAEVLATLAFLEGAASFPVVDALGAAASVTTPAATHVSARWAGFRIPGVAA